MDNKDLIIEQYSRQIAELTTTINTLTESNIALTETIKQLQETIKELQRQLNQNSQNSSKPPSSDGFNKPKPQSQRQKSGNRRVGRKVMQASTWLFHTIPMRYRLTFQRSVCPALI